MNCSEQTAYCLRRLKCDRQVPCSSCSKRGGPDECTYSNTGRNGRGKRDRTGESKNAEAHLRLQKLEEMVTGLMQSNGGSDSNSENASSNSGAVDQNLEDLIRETSLNPAKTCSGARGRLDINGSETRYHGATHWTAILENVCQTSLAECPPSSQTTKPYTASDVAFIVKVAFNTKLTYSRSETFKLLSNQSRKMRTKIHLPVFPVVRTFFLIQMRHYHLMMFTRLWVKNQE